MIKTETSSSGSGSGGGGGSSSSKKVVYCITCAKSAVKPQPTNRTHAACCLSKLRKLYEPHSPREMTMEWILLVYKPINIVYFDRPACTRLYNRPKWVFS